MSLWTTRRSTRSGGSTEITSLPFVELAWAGAPLAVFVTSCVAVPLALGPPLLAGAVLYGLLGAGLALFLLAKASVVRKGRLVSFGSRDMSAAMRRCYRLGYALCGVGVALAVGVLSRARARSSLPLEASQQATHTSHRVSSGTCLRMKSRIGASLSK